MFRLFFDPNSSLYWTHAPPFPDASTADSYQVSGPPGPSQATASSPALVSAERSWALTQDLGGVSASQEMDATEDPSGSSKGAES